MTYPDTIREVGSEFVRQLPDSVWVFFDALGRHVRTRNRAGHLTTFVYDGSGRLSTITLPPAAAPAVYTFSYNANGRLATVTADLTKMRINRDPFVRRIDGVVFGDDPRQGFFEGQRFNHPDLAFRIDFPTGWKTQNQPSAVVAVSPAQDAMVALSPMNIRQCPIRWCASLTLPR